MFQVETSGTARDTSLSLQGFKHTELETYIIRTLVIEASTIQYSLPAIGPWFQPVIVAGNPGCRLLNMPNG